MRKISRQTAFRIADGKRSPGPFVVQLRTLKVGESIFVSVEEWVLKTDPSIYVGSYFRASRTGLRYSVKKTKQKDGWVITRLPDRSMDD